jgi:hypothetical protein
MKATLAVINQMQADGVIGGQSSSPLTLAPVYEYLAVRGYQASGEYIIIEGWQVQFLPPDDDLGEEALAQAIETQVDDVPTLVMTAEHLVALALQLGRPKDFTRILQFVETGVLDANKLDQVLARHSLLAKWERFGDRFLRNL